MLAGWLSTLLILGRANMVGLSDGSPSVDTKHLFSWSSCVCTHTHTNVVQAVENCKIIP